MTRLPPFLDARLSLYFGFQAVVVEEDMRQLELRSSIEYALLSSLKHEKWEFTKLPPHEGYLV